VKRKDSVGSHAHTDAVGEGAEGICDAVHVRGPRREGEHDSLRRERRSGLCLATTEGRGGSSLRQPTKTGGARSGDRGEPDHGVLTETRHRVQVWHITIYPLRGSTAWIQGDNNLGPGKEHMVDLFVFCWRGGLIRADTHTSIGVLGIPTCRRTRRTQRGSKTMTHFKTKQFNCGSPPTPKRHKKTTLHHSLSRDILRLDCPLLQPDIFRLSCGAEAKKSGKRAKLNNSSRSISNRIT